MARAIVDRSWRKNGSSLAIVGVALFAASLQPVRAGAAQGAPLLPAGQTSADIGKPRTKGTATFENGRYVLKGGGKDVGGRSDQFQFVYQQIVGDVDITVRVASIQSTVSAAKAGVMIRESLRADARNAFALFSVANGYAFQRRIDPGGYTQNTDVSASGLPGWVRLTRRGYELAAFRSVDGQTWVAIGTDTIPMQESVYVGLVVSAHSQSGTATATFDNLSIVSMANQSPTVSITSPAGGATFSAPATISVAANASDPEGRLAQVEFFNGGTSLGRIATAPYSATWSAVPAGTYTLTAVASDVDGGHTTSTPVTISVGAAASSAPSTVVFSASPDHASMVTSYRLEVFANGADPNTAPPIASSDLGKPGPDANGDISVDCTAFFTALANGTYVATVSAIGSGQSARSAPVSFAR